MHAASAAATYLVLVLRVRTMLVFAAQAHVPLEKSTEALSALLDGNNEVSTVNTCGYMLEVAKLNTADVLRFTTADTDNIQMGKAKGRSSSKLNLAFGLASLRIVTSLAITNSALRVLEINGFTLGVAAGVELARGIASSRTLKDVIIEKVGLIEHLNIAYVMRKSTARLIYSQRWRPNA